MRPSLLTQGLLNPLLHPSCWQLLHACCCRQLTGLTNASRLFRSDVVPVEPSSFKYVTWISPVALTATEATLTVTTEAAGATRAVTTGSNTLQGPAGHPVKLGCQHEQPDA
jgi:hypothetical protein